MNRESILRRRIKVLTWIFILGLIGSGLTAIPLEWEMNLVLRLLGVTDSGSDSTQSSVVHWLLRVREGLSETHARFPFLMYGFDWLAFGHFMIAIAFIGVLRDPVRNIWLFDFGLIACVLVIPWALTFGAARGIPLGWRMIDCSFGVFGLVPLFLAKKWAKELSMLSDLR